MNTPKGSRGARLRVIDRARLAQVAEWVSRQRKGTWRNEAERKTLGISQPTLSRLMAGQMDFISEATYRSLEEAILNHFWKHFPPRRALPPDQEEQRQSLCDALRDAITDPAEVDLELTFYLPWLAERAARMLHPDTRRAARSGHEIYELTADDAPRHGKAVIGPRGVLTGVAYLRWQAVVQLVREIEKDPELATLWRGFSEWLQQHGFPDDGLHSRARVAQSRVLEPFLEAEESGFVERGWDEMAKEDRYQILRHGIAREKILLDRSPDRLRVREVLGLSTAPHATRARPRLTS